ncbi:MAG TPA: hypothetical protein VIL36_06235 [Acidimicrobiales bacterium]
MAAGRPVLGELVPAVLRRRLVDHAARYRFTPPDPRGGGAFAMASLTGTDSAVFGELLAWLAPRAGGLPGWSSFVPNEVSYQRYEAGGRGLPPHRDQRYYLHAIVIVTLTGEARFALLGSADPGDVVDGWTTRPGEVIALAGWSPHGDADPRPYHQVDAPDHGHRLMLQLRQNAAATPHLDLTRSPFTPKELAEAHHLTTLPDSATL